MTFVKTALVFVVMFVLACSLRSGGPKDPVWGKQGCEHCSMLVSEKKPSAQILTQDGSHLYFDDIGCMVLWMSAGKATPKTIWVRDPSGEGWKDARASQFAGGATTPMDFGFLPTQQGGRSFEEMTQSVLETARRRKEGTR